MDKPLAPTGAPIGAARGAPRHWWSHQYDTPEHAFRLRPYLRLIGVPHPGEHIIMTRATDAKGNTQPDEVRFNEKSYLFNQPLPHPIRLW